MANGRGLKYQDPLSLEAFYLDELSREIGYESDEDALLEELPSEREPRAYGQRTRMDLYFDETIPKMSDKEFRANFRVSRETLSTMVDILGDRSGNPTGAGPLPTPREKQLMLTLFYLGSTVSIRKVAEQFEMVMSTAYLFVEEMIERLAELRDVFIRLPAGHQMLGTLSAFEDICGVKGVLGAISDCHISMRKPGTDSDAYAESDAFANTRGFFSFHLMTVCDAHDRFTDINVGWPGGMHESEVLDRSSLASQLSDESVRHTHMPSECFLVGGSSLPLRTWLMTPYRPGRVAAGDSRKQLYNRLIRRTAEVSRHAASVLKSRFRRLAFVDTKNVKKAVQIACATCVLHNMCLSLDDPWTQELEEADPTLPEEEDGPGPGGNLASAAAHRRRTELVSEIWNMQQPSGK